MNSKGRRVSAHGGTRRGISVIQIKVLEPGPVSSAPPGACARGDCQALSPRAGSEPWGWGDARDLPVVPAPGV